MEKKNNEKSSDFGENPGPVALAASGWTLGLTCTAGAVPIGATKLNMARGSLDQRLRVTVSKRNGSKS